MSLSSMEKPHGAETSARQKTAMEGASARSHPLRARSRDSTGWVMDSLPEEGIAVRQYWPVKAENLAGRPAKLKGRAGRSPPRPASPTGW